MEETTFRMTGYHGTCSRYMESIAKNGLDPKYSHYRKDHWLGQGVYFFEDYTIAKNWAQDIAMQSRNFGSVPVVYEAQIQADKKEVLDLDNYKVCDIFLSYILNMQEEIEADTKDRYPVFKPEQFRAVYFDYYKIQKGISVIIYTFTKEIAKYGTLRSAEERKRQIVLAKALGIGYKEKQICVSKKECIDTVCVKYNGEDEVI